MTTQTAPAPASLSTPANRMPRWPAGVAVAAGVALAWSGGAAGLAGALVAAVGAAALCRNPAAPVAHAPVAVESSVGAAMMVSRVVPVWAVQLETTRDTAAHGLEQILTAFGEMSGAIDQLTTQLGGFDVVAEPGAFDGAVREASPALLRLLAPAERAFAERDAAVQELGRCAQAMQELQQLAREARDIARHTRLVAFNASIEANRNQQQQDGASQAVATEVRSLAARIAASGESIDRIVQGLGASLLRSRRQAEVGDTTPEELRLEIDLRAREALTALLGAVGPALQGSTELAQSGAALRQQIEAVFMHFQFGDRVSQMLSIVGNDMNNLVRWLAANPRATPKDATEWLAALEASYTMDEQRAQHHGNVHVQRSAGVEFF